MRRFVGGLRIRSLVPLVAIAAVVFAATRVEGSPVAGVIIVGACIYSLSYKRYSEAVALRQAVGSTFTLARRIGMLLAATTVAVAVIGLSDLAFLTGYYGYLEVVNANIRISHWTPYNQPRHMVTGGVIGVMLALIVATSLRRTIRLLDTAQTTRLAARSETDEDW